MTLKSLRFVMCAAAVCAAFAPVPSRAGLVAKWDFNNYDPSNPTSPNILAATVGGAGKPCYYVPLAKVNVGLKR